jgi:hypothetical protein
VIPVSYDLAGAAKATGYSERTISDAIAKGDLVAKTLTDKPGSKKSIRRADLEAWVDSLPTWKPTSKTA